MSKTPTNVIQTDVRDVLIDSSFSTYSLVILEIFGNFAIWNSMIFGASDED